MYEKHSRKKQEESGSKWSEFASQHNLGTGHLSQEQTERLAMLKLVGGNAERARRALADKKAKQG